MEKLKKIKVKKYLIFNDVFLTDIIHGIKKSMGIDNFKDKKILVKTDDY